MIESLQLFLNRIQEAEKEIGAIRSEMELRAKSAKAAAAVVQEKINELQPELNEIRASMQKAIAIGDYNAYAQGSTKNDFLEQRLPTLKAELEKLNAKPGITEADYRDMTDKLVSIEKDLAIGLYKIFCESWQSMTAAFTAFKAVHERLYKTQRVVLKQILKAEEPPAGVIKFNPEFSHLRTAYLIDRFMENASAGHGSLAAVTEIEEIKAALERG